MDTSIWLIDHESERCIVTFYENNPFYDEILN